MDFLQSLSESKLFPTQASLDRKRSTEIADLTFHYLLAIRILLAESETRRFAKTYAKRTAEWGDFEKWRATVTDFYVLLHRLNDMDHPEKDANPYPINLSQIQKWLASEGRGQHNEAMVRRIFSNLDFSLKNKGVTAKAMRRKIMDWPEESVRDKAYTLYLLVKWFTTNAARSDLLKDLKRLAKEYKEQDDKEEE